MIYWQGLYARPGGPSIARGIGAGVLFRGIDGSADREYSFPE